MVKKKLIACLMAVAVTGSLFVGCGSSSENASSTDGKEITIWTKVKEDEMKVIEDSAKKWAEDTGNTVKVVNDEGEFQDYLQAANSSKGPDVYIGMPHDNLASFKEAGLLEEVPDGIFDKDKYTSESVWEATSFEGKNYAVPLAQESVALFYNKDKVKEVPKTMDDLIKVAKENDNGFQIDLGNFYITGGIIQSYGGYIFGGKSGNYDVKDIGLANAGSQEGYQFLQDLVLKEKLMPADITGDIASSNFKDGKSAFYISGPWDVAQFEKAGLNFGVAKIPTIKGGDYKSFLGVQTAMVSSKSQNKDLSWDLLKHIVDNEGEALLKAGNRIPVLKTVADSQTVKDNQYFQGFIEQANSAIPMPNILEMQAVWNATSQITRLYKGESPETVGKDVVSAIEKGIQAQGQ
ncbi:maltose ABC transporter substrate-binding protein [Clostridium sp.]|uniref:sugar ABC transporter substrate-binding protein n=1 Tax=Clostridium sp. TaxID=1506 RepID=UPI002A91E46E|nr:maltose ABC transporter substrate-binding protein [Clostridium sp.]MDY6013171.1 maltose ABC transporter substrate-binding protein [Clostridium sp.]